MPVPGLTGVVPSAVTITVPDVEAGRPFGPKPPAATPTGVTVAPVAAFVAATEFGETAMENVLPTAVAGCTSHVSESMFAVPAETRSGTARLKFVTFPLVTVVTFVSEPPRLDASRTLQSVRFATEPFALAPIVSGMDVML